MKKHLKQIVVARTIQFFTSAVIATAILSTGDVKAAYPVTDPDGDGSINVGRAGGTNGQGQVGPGDNFTVLTGNGDFSISDSSFVHGDVGVNANGNYNGSGSGSVTTGDVYINTGHVNLSGGSKIGGHTYQGTTNMASTRLANAWADAMSLSSAAAGLSATANYTVNGMPVTIQTELTNINLDKGSSMTIADNTPHDEVVLRLQDFRLNNGSTLTLQGTPTTTFIIDVSHSFSLNMNSRILLSGVPAANVLYNVLPSGGDANISGGAMISGVILNVNHKVQLSGGSKVLVGQVIAHNVEMSGGSGVVTPITNR